MTHACVTTIDLLRHGECEGGLIFRGHTDSALSTKGQQQMQQAIDAYPGQANWQQIISSPLQRCSVFAQQLIDCQNHSATLLVEPGLQEISFGDWDGCLTEQVQQQQPTAVSNFWQNPAEHTPPNGELLTDFQQRVVHSWQQLVEQHRGEHSLLISHGGVIRIILAHILQMPLRPLSYLSAPHACLTQIKIFHQAGSPDWPQLIFHQPLLSSTHS
ncbi:histidine phosphatase family protein [Dasania marina]|uniref:histidine phosphatase family protein n=1 Tax=Dasania marina TaxID=471499 RepID=UPI0030D7F497|tara:strand:+ start:29966 stop:30610 length:645 start_codon:yes stop_codon:yes gene_type:complete